MEMTDRRTLASLRNQKSRGEKILMLTCYDAATAALQDEAGVDAFLVGDSMAQTVLGYGSTSELPLEAMLHHTTAVVRAGARPYVLADLPYIASQDEASARAAAEALAAAGADGVKFEGANPHLAPLICAAGLDPWGHLGYTPQTMPKPALQARDAASAEALEAHARSLVEAGIVGMIVELIPEALATRLSRELPILVIGIGAGEGTDGQVQVWQDLIGFSPIKFRHAWRFAETRQACLQAIQSYRHRLQQAVS